jgi:hypothetical protein
LLNLLSGQESIAILESGDTSSLNGRLGKETGRSLGREKGSWVAGWAERRPKKEVQEGGWGRVCSQLVDRCVPRIRGQWWLKDGNRELPKQVFRDWKLAPGAERHDGGTSDHPRVAGRCQPPHKWSPSEAQGGE